MTAAAVCQWDMMSTSAVCQHDSEQLDMTCELLFINCFSVPTYCMHWQDDADFTGSILPLKCLMHQPAYLMMICAVSLKQTFCCSFIPSVL